MRHNGRTEVFYWGEEGDVILLLLMQVDREIAIQLSDSQMLKIAKNLIKFHFIINAKTSSALLLYNWPNLSI
jgi:hypothetical protein